MLTQTKEVRDAWRASQRTLDIKVTVNGKTYTATDINSLKYDSGAYTGDTFAIGSTYSNSVQIEFSHLIENLKLGMEVLPSIGIKTSGGYVYEPLGVFIISSEIKMDRNNNLTSISASDRFCGLEGTYKSKLAYPAKVLDVIAEICAQSGVRANVDDLARLPHQADLPSAITGQTYRKALGWIAQLYAGYATFDRQGLFTIRTIAEPNYELDPSQYEQAGLTKNEAPYRISGIQCQTTITTKTRDGEDTEETKNYQVGDSNGSQIKLENNIMTPDRLTNIWEQIKDINFYPFSLNWFGNPAIEAGDWLKLQDKQGNKFIVPNNSYTLDFNGGLSATSKADQTSSTDSVIAWEGTFSQTIRELQGRKAPDGTVIFPPSVTEPPTNAKPNDVWFKQNGNSTELWVFTEQEDGIRKWVRRDLTPDEIKKQVQEAQDGLKDAKKEIADNLAKADSDIAELNASIGNQKGTIDGLSTTVNTVVIPKVTDVTNQVSDAIKKVNEQKNIVTGLQNQAIQQGKDISKITTDVHGVTVDLANLNGDVNQTKATVQGLQSTLGNAQGDIAQIKVDAKKLETSLSGKVDNSTYANFVSATNNALNAKLVASDLNGYAKTTDLQATANGLQLNINSVTDKLNNLRIGADNLLNGTGNFRDYLTNVGGQINEFSKDDYIPPIQNHPEITAYIHSWEDWESAYSNQRILLEKDKTYWFGFYYCTDRTDGSPFKAFNIYSNKDNATSNPKLWGYFDTSDYSFFGNSSRKWLWCTLKIIGDGEVYQNFRAEPSGVTHGSAYFAGYTLVQSDVAPTGHVDSFEDTEHELSQLSAQITANNQKFSSYYTKIETDTRTNSAKNDAVDAIKNDNNWHGLTNILTNSGFIQTADGFIQKVQQTMQPIINKNNSGGVNLLTNTYTLRNFNNAGNAGEATGFEIDSGDSHKNELNAGEISTNVFHVYAKDLNHAPVYFGQNFTLPKGTWTLSFLARHNGSSEQKIRTRFYTDDSANFGWNPLGVSDDISNVWEKHQIQFSVTKETYEINPRLHTPTDDGIPGGSLYFANFKLESGSIATTWCPAPEDLAKQVEVTELNQTIKGLQSTVSSNYGNLQSQISQTAGTIRNEITDRTNNLQSQITQNANNISFKVNAVGDLSNICLNPTFIDGSTEGWENVISSSGDPGSPTKFYGGVNTRNAHYGNMFAVAAGDKYFFSVFAWQNQSTQHLNVGFAYIQKDGTWNWQSAINFAPNEGARTKSGSITIPKEAVKARIWVEIDSYSDFGNWWFTNLIVRKNDTISQINMSAGTTLIQNDKIYMDASSTVFSGKAFIPDAAITNISADKINTGTLDAGRINVINLNANNITTGTINGANLKIDLNSGEILFQKGRIGSTNGYLNIDIDSGKMSVTNSVQAGVYFENGELYLSDNWTYGPNSQPKYGVIRRSIHSFTLGECGAEIASPSGISLQTMNYDGAFGAAGFLDQTTSGASVAIDRNGQALINAKQVGLTGGTFFTDNHFIPSKRRPRIVVGTDADASGLNLWGWGDPLNHVASRIVIDASYVHFPNSYNTTTGSAPNLYIASDGAIVRSTSASKYKTEIKRSYSTEYGEKLLNLPTAIWTDKGQKERYEAGKRHIKPEKYFGMIAEDLADAGLDLLVSRNPQTHEIEGIQYERIAPALLPVIKELKDKVNRLEKKVNE
ncbi:gp58-like family protein [Lactobacillus johnsonii]